MKKIIYSLCFAALALCLASCDSHDEPAPREPGEVSTAPGIYFTNSDNILSVTVGQDTHVSIPVRRINNEGDLAVPLVVTSEQDALIYPDEVRFADGQYDSAIVLDLANLPTKKLYGVVITFPDEYINPYCEGPSVFDGSVIVSDWEEVSDTPIQFTWLNWSYEPSDIFDPVDQVVMHLPGTTRYRILDFLHSGVDFSFDLKPSEYPAWVGYNRIMPMGNQVLYSEYNWSGYYNAWWLTDATLQEWPSLELSANSNPVELFGASFMWYDDEYQNEYCYMRLAGSADAYGNIATKTFGYMAFYGFYDESWDWSNFTGYILLYFELPAE